MFSQLQRTLHSDDPRMRLLRFVLILLATSLAVFAYSSSLGCGEQPANGCPGSSTTSDYTNSDNQSQPPNIGSMTPSYDRSVAPGGRVALKFTANHTTGTAVFRWSPPQGASAFAFLDIQPLGGGPPFVFSDITPAQAQAGINVAYTAPAQVPAAAGGLFWDGLDIAFSDRSRIYLVEWHQLSADLRTDRAPAAPAAPRDPAATVPMWRVGRWVDIRDSAMTTSLCQSYVESGQSSNMFFAWRVPIAATINPDQVYQLPVVDTATLTPTMRIAGTVKFFDMPLEYRPDLMQWANLNLPAQAGAWWLALSLDRSVSITCPAGFDLPSPPGWSFNLEVRLDLSSQPGQCTNCVLPSYGCFKSTGVADLSSAQRLLIERGISGFGRDIRALPLPDNWICFGPNESPLVTGGFTPAWKLDAFTTYVNISATQPITVHYWVENNYGTAQTFDLNLQSDLTGAAWQIFKSKTSNTSQPDLTSPHGSQIVVPAHTSAGTSSNHFWMLTNAPAGASGQYNVSLTLSDAAASPTAWTGRTTIWVGVPPEVAPPATANPLYLPMLTR